MAKEHHCPNCGPQACNASTSKIHTCGVCAAVWEEVISDAVPTRAPTAAAPTAPATPPKPAPAATSAAAAPKPATPAAPPSPRPAAPVTPPSSTPAVPGTAAAATKPTAPAPTAPATATPPAPTASVPGIDRPAAGRKPLSEVVGTAKVKLCPQCRSDNLKQPNDCLEVQGRIVLVDSQSYRPHMWFADTGEAYAPPSAPGSASVAPAAKAG